MAPRRRMKFQVLSTVVCLVLVAVVAAWMAKPYLASSFPYTHDGENHLARFVNYAAALREGQIPPRFAPYIQSGFGFPVFHYNYPLGNILAAPGIWLGLHPGTLFGFLTFLSAAIGIVSVFAVLRRDFSRAASLFGVGWYVFSAYWASAVFFRGSIGEILMYGIVPLLIWLWQQFFAHPGKIRWGVGTAAGTAAALLAHNVLALLVLPCIALWTLSRVLETKQSRAWLLIWLGAVGLVSWFWFPAVLELSFVVLQQDSLATSAQDHLLTWSQIWFSPLRFGFSRTTALDTLGFGLGAGAFFLILTGAAGLLTSLRSMIKQSFFPFWRLFVTERRSTGVLLVLVGITALYLSSDTSRWLWDAVPALSIIQFPWRFHFLVSLLLPVFAAFVWKHLSATHWLLLIFFGMQIVTVSGLQPVDTRTTATDYYLTFPHSTTTRNENRPTTLVRTTLGEWTPAPRIASGAAELTISTWLGSRRAYSVHVQEDVLLVEPTIYFSGWKTWVDGEPVAYDLEAEASGGLIAYRLKARPEQPYQVRTVFRERTVIRLLSEATTVATLVFAVGVVWWKRHEW